MLIHNFIVKLVKFGNGLLFALNYFFKNYIIVIYPYVNLFESPSRNLYHITT
jgi:hypothetical protein